MAATFNIEDGDSAWLKVNNRLPPHELPPGVAAGGSNKRFEDGRAWPRYGVASQAWGAVPNPTASSQLIPANSVYDGTGNFNVTVQSGQYYFIVLGGDEIVVYNGPAGSSQLTGSIGVPIYFQAAFNVVNLEGHNGNAVTATITGPLLPVPAPRAFKRFPDPFTAIDQMVVCTDDWRSNFGEDGGRGRVWRIVSGNPPVQVPLNGQDIYGECRLIPADNALVLLRQDNERHYFPQGGVTGNVITLNCAPTWNSGDRVYFWADPLVASSLAGLNTGQWYYVKNNIGGNPNAISLFMDPGLANIITLGAAFGRFYLERQATNPGFYGNGAPPLFAQPDAAGDPWNLVGFTAVPQFLTITGTGTSVQNNLIAGGTTTVKTMTVPNHRFVAGDAIVIYNSQGNYNTGTASTSSFYVYPLDANTLVCYSFTTAVGPNDALSNNVQNAVDPFSGTAFAPGDYIKLQGITGSQPMPSAREGCYLPIGVLVLVNGLNNLVISNPGDIVHFTKLSDELTANLGEAEGVASLLPLSSAPPGLADSVLIGKPQSLLLLSGLSGPQSGWSLITVTSEYGALAALGAVTVGADGWNFGRKGVVSVIQTEYGQYIGRSEPRSLEIQGYINQVDFVHAKQVCADSWNNRTFFAVPLKGQVGTVVNNGLLVWNALNQGWEPIWTGPNLQMYGMDRCTVFGEERLCFVDYQCQVHWLWGAAIDEVNGVNTPVQDSLLTRLYTGVGGDGQARAKFADKLWKPADLIWDTLGASITVQANWPGAMETDTLISGFSPTGNLYYGQTGQQGQADFSTGPTGMMTQPLEELQTLPERFWMNRRHWGVQLLISNTSGVCKVRGVSVAGSAVGRSASQKT